MASVYFQCNCAKKLAMDVSEAGRQFCCPDCGKFLCVPSPEIYWTCACGEMMSAPNNLAGGLVRCVACGAEHPVPVRLGLKRGKQLQTAPSSDVPRVPVGRTNEIQCPKCGYMSPPVLALCPQCQSRLHKGAIIRRQCILVAQVLLIIGLGWFLAANFARISGCVKSWIGVKTTPAGGQVESPPVVGNVTKVPAAGVPAGR